MHVILGIYVDRDLNCLNTVEKPNGASTPVGLNLRQKKALD
jgi:hypothetical protein